MSLAPARAEGDYCPLLGEQTDKRTLERAGLMADLLPRATLEVTQRRPPKAHPEAHMEQSLLLLSSAAPQPRAFPLMRGWRGSPTGTLKTALTPERAH